jgi:DNA-binding IclR family transcriptional regulator
MKLISGDAIASSTFEDDRTSIKSLQKALAVIDAVSRAEVPPRVAEVAIQVGVPRPTAYRIVQTLIAEGYLMQDPHSARLSIGYSVLAHSASLLDRNRLRLEALPHLQSLANHTGQRVNLGILHRNQVLYLAGVEKPSLPTIYTRFGKSAPAHCCSLGKAILAYLPEAELASLLAARPLRAHTPRSITSLMQFREELETIRQQRYATDREEHVTGSFCVAATIFDGQNSPIGAIGLSDRSLEAMLEHVAILQHTAELISYVV